MEWPYYFLNLPRNLPLYGFHLLNPDFPLGPTEQVRLSFGIWNNLSHPSPLTTHLSWNFSQEFSSLVTSVLPILRSEVLPQIYSSLFVSLKALDSRKVVLPWESPPLSRWFCLGSGCIPPRWIRSRWLLPTWSLLHLWVHPHLGGLIFWEWIETWVMPPSNPANCFSQQQQLPPTFSWQGSKSRWGLWNFYTALNRSGTLTVPWTT